MTDSRLHAVYVLAMAVAAVAAVYDWRRGEIPNWLTFGTLLLAPLIHGVRAIMGGASLQAAAVEGGNALLGALLCALVPWVLYRAGGLGGGDLKLFAGLGALLHPLVGLEAETYSFVLLLVVVAPMKLAFKGELFAALKGLLLVARNLVLPKAFRRPVDHAAFQSFRLGPAAFAGVLLAVKSNW
jgi:prepilin peptidase CpaA